MLYSTWSKNNLGFFKTGLKFSAVNIGRHIIHDYWLCLK